MGGGEAVPAFVARRNEDRSDVDFHGPFGSFGDLNSLPFGEGTMRERRSGPFRPPCHVHARRRAVSNISTPHAIEFRDGRDLLRHSAHVLIARPVSHSHDRATQCLARRPRRTTDVHRAPPRRIETLGQTSRDSAKQVYSWVENEMGTGGDRVSTSTGPVAGRVLAEENQRRLASPAPPPRRRPGSGLTGASATGDRTVNSELRVATWAAA